MYSFPGPECSITTISRLLPNQLDHFFFHFWGCSDLAGKQQWESIEEAVHQIVTHSEDEYSLTYEDLKCMLDWKERLEDLSMKVHPQWCKNIHHSNKHLITRAMTDSPFLTCEYDTG